MNTPIIENRRPVGPQVKIRVSEGITGIAESLEHSLVIWPKQNKNKKKNEEENRTELGGEQYLVNKWSDSD